MKDIIIIGAGGHGAELNDYIEYNNLHSANTLSVRGFLDDDPENYSRYKFSAPLLGGVKNHRPITDFQYIIGVANLAYRRNIVDRFLSAGAEFVSLIHISACISPSATIGHGVVIGPNVNIGPNVKIGDYTYLMPDAVWVMILLLESTTLLVPMYVFQDSQK